MLASLRTAGADRPGRRGDPRPRRGRRAKPHLQPSSWPARTPALVIAPSRRGGSVPAARRAAHGSAGCH